jgi:hypothetical protein
MQKLLTLIIGGAMLYMIFQQNLNFMHNSDNASPKETSDQNDNSPTKPEKEFSGNFVEKTISNILSNVIKTEDGRIFVKNLVQPMNKAVSGGGASFDMNSNNSINSMFQISSFDEGVKGPATCGHMVSAHYKILDDSNFVLKEKTENFLLGENKIEPGLDAVIVGMKTGQTRHATIINKYLQGNSDDQIKSFKVNILLKSIIPENFIDDRVKIFDDQLTYNIPLICGDNAIYHAKITKLSNGEVIYNSADSGQKIDMIIGNPNYPVIFSHALHNKVPIGTRSVISPGKFFKSHLSDNSVIFPNQTLLEDEYFMIEFSDFDKSIFTDNINLSK